MISALKDRINELQGEETDWKNKIVEAWNYDKDLRQSLKPNKVQIGEDDDARSVRSEGGRSNASEAKSVASERSISKEQSLVFNWIESIQELKEKKTAKKDFDLLTTTTERKQATLEERIAKHVADEIIRNNKVIIMKIYNWIAI